MTQVMLPQIARSLVVDEPLSEFMFELRRLGVDTYDDPSMRLLSVAELAAMPPKIKKDAYEQMTALAVDLSQRKPTSLQVERATVKVDRRKGTVALKVTCDPVVSYERRQITHVLGRHGVDVYRRPFTRYAFYAGIGVCAMDGMGMTRRELSNRIEEVRPLSVSFAPPSY